MLLCSCRQTDARENKSRAFVLISLCLPPSVLVGTAGTRTCGSPPYFFEWADPGWVRAVRRGEGAGRDWLAFFWGGGGLEVYDWLDWSCTGNIFSSGCVRDPSSNWDQHLSLDKDYSEKGLALENKNDEGKKRNEKKRNKAMPAVALHGYCTLLPRILMFALFFQGKKDLKERSIDLNTLLSLRPSAFTPPWWNSFTL